MKERAKTGLSFSISGPNFALSNGREKKRRKSERGSNQLSLCPPRWPSPRPHLVCGFAFPGETGCLFDNRASERHANVRFASENPMQLG